MPLERHPGTAISDLETAVANIERSRARIVQIVGLQEEAWWILTEPTAQVRETRGGAQ